MKGAIEKRRKKVRPKGEQEWVRKGWWDKESIQVKERI